MNRNSKPRYPLRKRDPPWLETISVTPELVYRYQMAVRDFADILESDLNVLKDINQVIAFYLKLKRIHSQVTFLFQPVLVNDQLNQLYVEMELEGLSTQLTLEEGITSSSSSGEDNNTSRNTTKVSGT